MTFGESVTTCFTKYFQLKGRAPRSEYWWFGLFIFLVNIVGAFFGEMTSMIIFLAFFIPSWTVTVRRLHDRDRSGWWSVLPYGLLILGAAMMADESAAVGSLVVIAGCVSFILLLVWMFMRGTYGDNYYGPDPLAVEDTVAEPQAAE